MELMHLTVTLYLIVQGIVPSVFGELSQNIGRRPVYLTVCVIYLVAPVIGNSELIRCLISFPNAAKRRELRNRSTGL